MIRIGTRWSDLALYQAKAVADLLEEKGFSSEIIIIHSQADQQPNRPLEDFKNKSIFTASLTSALHRNEIDCVVHSLKDLSYNLHAQSQLVAYLPRASVSDVLILKDASVDMNQPFCVGTSSLRRQALIKHHYPLATIESIRGNVPTRLNHLHSSDTPYDAIVLAQAGLERLDKLKGQHVHILDAGVFVPCGGQGIIGVECRQQNQVTIETLQTINDPNTSICAIFERMCLKHLAIDCGMPFGIHATHSSGTYNVAVFASRDDKIFSYATHIAADTPMLAAQKCIKELIEKGIRDYL